MATTTAQPYTKPAQPPAYPKPTTAHEALRYLYAIRGRAHYYGAWVKVSVKIGDDITFSAHQIGNGGDEVFSFLAASIGLWEILNEWRDERAG